MRNEKCEHDIYEAKVSYFQVNERHWCKLTNTNECIMEGQSVGVFNRGRGMEGERERERERKRALECV